MQFNYKRITIILTVALTLSLLVTFSVLAGDIDSPSAPTDSGSQMFTLENIYDRLSSNGDSARVDEFAEPAAGPSSTMHTLDDIYALSYPARVQKTGQTECYDVVIIDGDPVGVTTPCAGTGQDGEFQKGVDWPNPRFTINGDNNGDGDCLDAGDACNGTVTDNMTGLVWLMDADCWRVGYSWGWTDWQTALNQANALADGSCGLSDGSTAGDWRLPSITEITSVIHYGVDHPSVPDTAGTGQSTTGNPFFYVRNTAYYWTSTSFTTNPVQAWRVGLGNSTAANTDKTDNAIGWAVRDQQ